MSDYSDEYSDFSDDDELANAINQPLIERPLPPSKPDYDTPAYYFAFKIRMACACLRVTGLRPYPWQLDIGLKAHLGLDVMLIAGTGFGKTLVFILLCFIDLNIIVWIISPLNALANQQAKQLNSWGIRSVAVNANTSSKELFNDIKNGQYRVIISSIEAFTDTSRLLPAVISPELAARGRQLWVLDEAHCLSKWAPSFRPKYSMVGDLKLLSSSKISFIAATATANIKTRKEIARSLHFGPDAYTRNLGNYRHNIAYSVHRLPRGASSIREILEYFPSRTEFKEYTLVFVDSRPLGQAVLDIIRQHVIPEIRWQVQIYHAFRSEYMKEILAGGFEREGKGFRVMVCTEALTMGVDFRKVTRVIQVLAPSDAETWIQRSGRGGRDEDLSCEAILMAQDSMFEDSKEGQKRLEDMIKQEEPTETTQSTKQDKQAAAKRIAAAGKGKVNRPPPRTFTDGIYRVINPPGCHVEVLDQECDNPPRDDSWKETCECEWHRRSRGEPTYREVMRQERDSLEAQEGDTIPEELVDIGVGTEDTETDDEGDDSEVAGEEDIGTPDSDVEMLDEKPNTTGVKLRTPARRKPYIAALQKWLDDKYDSDECQDWNLTKEWILSDKEIVRIARDPRLTTTEALAGLVPPWMHVERWGEQLLEVLDGVTSELEAKKRQQEEEKARQKAAKVRAAEEARELKLARLKRPLDDSQPSNTQPSSQRPRLGPDMMPDQKHEEKRLAKNAKARERYWAKKQGQSSSNLPPITPDAQPVAGPSTVSTPGASTWTILSPTALFHPPPVPQLSTPGIGHFTTFQAKQEFIDNHDQLLGQPDNNNNLATRTPGPSRTLPTTLPTPHTPTSTPQLQFMMVTNAEIQRTYEQPTPASRGKRKATNDLLSGPTMDTPSVPRAKRRPKMKSAASNTQGEELP